MMGLMESYDLAKKIVLKLNQEGYIAYFAGGWVRDYVLGHPSNDIDIATDCPTEKLLQFFPDALLVGLSFGVIVLPIEGHLFEIATFRKDIDYQNGRSPERIEKATPEEDALRRDFTINGMFFDPLAEKIYDYVGGLEDLRKGVVRAIGNPFERFQEDRLRMVRAVRFSSRFGYPIEPDTEEAIKEYAVELTPAVAPERLYQELKKMSENSGFEVALYELSKLGLLQVMIPPLKGSHLNQIKQAIEKLNGLDSLPFILKLSVVFDLLSFESQIQSLEFLKAPRRDHELILHLELSHKFLQTSHTDHEWSKFYAHPDTALILKRLKIEGAHQERMNRLEFYIDLYKNKERIVTSQDLMELNIQPGKLMGELLKKSEEIACNQALREKNQVIEFLKRDPLWP